MFTMDSHLFLAQIHRRTPAENAGIAPSEKSEVFPLFNIKDAMGGNFKGRNDRKT